MDYFRILKDIFFDLRKRILFYFFYFFILFIKKTIKLKVFRFLRIFNKVPWFFIFHIRFIVLNLRILMHFFRVEIKTIINKIVIYLRLIHLLLVFLATILEELWRLNRGNLRLFHCLTVCWLNLLRWRIEILNNFFQLFLNFKFKFIVFFIWILFQTKIARINLFNYIFWEPLNT